MPNTHSKHRGREQNKTFKDVYGWGSSTICNILEKREYLGHTINFKTRKHFKDKKSHYVPEAELSYPEHRYPQDQAPRALRQTPQSVSGNAPSDTVQWAGVMRLLHELNEEGKTVIIVTHDQGIIEDEPYVVKIWEYLLEMSWSTFYVIWVRRKSL